MDKYLVLGGAGFIGSNLAVRLLEDGRDVRIFDDFSTGRDVNLDDIRDRVEVIRGDMRDASAVEQAFRDVKGAVLLAAIPSVIRSVEDPTWTNDVNINGTLTVLNAARAASIDRLVFASSAAVYGRSPELPKHEGLLPRPTSPYGVQKLTGEQYCRVFRELYDLPTVSLRFFNIFGPRQNLKSEYASAIPKFMRAVINGDSPIVFGDGEQTRDFVFVGNVVDALTLALTHNDPGPGPFNVGTGVSTSVNDLLNMIMKIVGKSVEIQYQPPRPGDVLASRGDISRAQEHLLYTPRVSVEEGLRRFFEWARAGMEMEPAK